MPVASSGLLMETFPGRLDSALLHWTLLKCTHQYRTGLYYTVLDWAGLYCTVLDCRFLYWTVLFCTGLYYSVLDYTGVELISWELEAREDFKEEIATGEGTVEEEKIGGEE